MLRFVLAFLTLYCFLNPVWATRNVRPTSDTDLLARSPLNDLATQQKGKARASDSQPDFVLTEESEVLLNGKACLFNDIPKDAEIIYLEVARDRKTVLKIHFRTRK